MAITTSSSWAGIRWPTLCSRSPLARNSGLGRAAIQHGLALCAPAKMRLQLCHPGAIRYSTMPTTPTPIRCWRRCKHCANCPALGRRVAVLGDMAELGGCSRAAHARLAGGRPNSRLDQLFAIGRRARQIAAAARARGFKTVVEIAEVETAAQAVKEFARPGDVVLVKASRSMRLERITEALRGPGKHHDDNMLFYLEPKRCLPWRGHAVERGSFALRLFSYITFRSAGAAVTALVLSWWLGRA